jgi:hypothetical protein
MDAARRRSRFRGLLDFLKRMLGKKPSPPPVDPFAYAMAPLRRCPKGRSSTAVAEIEEDSYRYYPPRRNRNCFLRVAVVVDSR